MTNWVECRDCHRELKDPESRALGYGPDCARKRGLTPTKPRRTRRPAQLALSRSADEPIPVIPGQTELPLVVHQPSLWSL